MNKTIIRTLTVLTTVLMLAPLVALYAGESDAPIVGAIRWDGWSGKGGVVKQMERSLGQPKYHFRLPWFAQVTGVDKVSINGDSQEIIEKEIDYAAEAGLDYWAFVDYWDQSADLSIALERYRAAKDKRGVRYCFVEEGSRMDTIGTHGFGRLVQHFKDPHYQTVLEGRPLLYVFVKTSKLGKPAWDELKCQTIAAGLKAPYLVLMGWNPAQDEKDRVALGFDAISAYARGGSYSMTQPSYAEQCALIRRDRWEKWRDLGIPSVTFVSAGWDTRPRNERPPSWMHKVTATPDPTPSEQQKPLIDRVTATPEELATHLREALEWTKLNRDINPSQAIIIYGWNEHDEGGWLSPTWTAEGKPNTTRLDALRSVLKPGHIPAFTNDVATDQWLRKQSPSYLRMAEYVDRKWGTEFGIATNSPGGLAYLKEGKGHIDLNETLKGAHRVSVIVFEMTNLYQQDRHEEITTPVRRGELQDATKFAMLRESVEYDGLRLHREVLVELERVVGELPPEMITWVSCTATNLSTYALPYAYDYFKAQAKGGHTEHYYRLFKRHTAEAKQAQAEAKRTSD